MKNRHFILIWTILLVSMLSQPLPAFGSKEKSSGAEREEARIIEFYVLAKGETGAAMTAAVGESAAAHLFQRFEQGNDGIRLIGSREFSMPIEERRVEERLSGSGEGLNLVYHRIELTPKRVGPYSSEQKVSVIFDIDDLTDDGRIRLQPAQYAVLQGIKESELAEGLVRIIEMKYRRGEISARLEFALPAE